MAKERKAYTERILLDPFEWRYESEEEYKIRTNALQNSNLNSTSDSLGDIFTYYMNRRPTNDSIVRYAEIVSELHRHFGTNGSDWESLAHKLIERHVPAFNKGKPGRSKSTHEQHLKVLRAYHLAQHEVMTTRPEQVSKSQRILQKTIHSIASRTLELSPDQFKERLRNARSWLKTAGSEWKKFPGLE